MSILIKKRFFVWQMHKEKEWLEEKAKEGYILCGVGFFKYYFEKGEPQDLVYEFDFQFMSKSKEEDYLAIFEGWKNVARMGGWYYFSKIREGDDKDIIFNDNDSKRQMFRRLLLFLGLVGLPMFYQVLFIFPLLDVSETTFPKFYFFARIIIYIFLVLYTAAIVRILLLYKALVKQIKE
jgi:hypothetical protein